MKLVSYPTSPFARKVRIAAFEAGLLDRLEIVDANPLADDGVVAKHNPLGKVPALVLDDRTLVDSPLICAYLDSLHCGSKLHPDGDLQWFEVWNARPAAAATAPPPDHPGASEALRSSAQAPR